jgi:hypothetical protein
MKWGKGVNVYRLPPIDHMWAALPTIADYRKSLVNEFEAAEVASQILALDEFLKNSLQTAKEYGWEGDFRNEPRVFLLPLKSEFRTCLVWKQDNDGTTFVSSPIELPWLTKEEV